GTSAARKDVSKEVFIITSRTKNTVMATPTPPTSHQNKPPSRPQVRPLESEAALVSVNRSSVFMLVGGRGLVRCKFRMCRRRQRYWNRGRRFCRRHRLPPAPPR